MKQLPPYSDRKTSLEAAVGILPFVRGLRGAVLQEILDQTKPLGGLTCSEIETRRKNRGLKAKHQTISARLNELVKLGILIHTDVRRAGSRVYIIDPDLDEKEAFVRIEEEKGQKSGPIDIGSVDPNKPNSFFKLGVPGSQWIRINLALWKEVAQTLETHSDSVDIHKLADAMDELFEQQRFAIEQSRSLEKKSNGESEAHLDLDLDF